MLIAKYGESTIQLGGSFLGESPYVDFELSEDLALIMSESPFTQRFDSRDYADAEDRANLWKTTIQDRIAIAIDALRANGDTFTREEVTTL